MGDNGFEVDGLIKKSGRTLSGRSDLVTAATAGRGTPDAGTIGRTLHRRHEPLTTFNRTAPRRTTHDLA